MKQKDKKKGNKVSNEQKIVDNKILRWVLIVGGTFFVVMGVIGIFLPLLPTTPFLLLAAWCYARSSKRFYNWLISNKWFGSYIKNYREGKGVPVKVKVISITFLWIMILFSVIFIIFNIYIRLILILIAIGVTIHILSIRTLK